MSFRLLLILLIAAAVGLVACGGDDDGSSATNSSNSTRVVATTTQVADYVRNVAEGRASVDQILAPNADPHAYELRPHDAEAVAGANLVVRSGGDVDDWLEDAITSAGKPDSVVTLIDSVDKIEGGHHEHDGDEEGEHAEEGEEVDPHWWQDPANVEKAIPVIETAIAKADPDGAALYRKNAARYLDKIRALDDAVAACWTKVPADERKLVTTHDALGYYAKRYGLEVIGTVIPSLSTQGQASAGELAELADTIRREHVKVVFAESSVNSKIEKAIADETGAKIGKPLWADTLGPAGSDGATYLESIASNTEAMVAGVTGGAVSCSIPTS